MNTLWFLLLTTCNASGCTTSEVHSYYGLEDCQFVAKAVNKADDTILAECMRKSS